MPPCSISRRPTMPITMIPNSTPISRMFRRMSPLRMWLNSCAITPCSSSRLSFSSAPRVTARSEEHTSELQSLMRISYAVFCLKKKTTYQTITDLAHTHKHIHLLQTEINGNNHYDVSVQTLRQ